MTSTTATDPRAWGEGLLEALGRQRAEVETLVKLSTRQRDLVREGRTDELLRVLARRQAVIDRLLAQQETIRVETRDLEARLARLEPALAGRVRGQLAAIGEDLARIMEADDADRGTLEGRRDEAGRELSGLNAAARARRSYGGGGRRGEPGPGPAPAPRFGDHRG